MDAASPVMIAPAVSGWRRAATRLFRLAEWLVWMAFFVAALAFLLLRYAVLPQVESYRSAIESALSRGLGNKVTIGRIEAGWEGLHPDLDLADVRVYDAAGRTALALPQVSVTVSWWTVVSGDLRLHALEIVGADLDIRRTRNGNLLVGGIELSQRDDGGSMSDWILGQRRISISESRVRWNDEKRAAGELALANIRAVLENSGSRHRFGFTADPPRNLASRLDIRADLHGESLSKLAQWRGTFYADLRYIDLAAWRAWVDYPADVRSGSGSVRAWLGFEGDHLEYFTADVGLENAQARLRRDLPLLELAKVSGRVGAREIASGGKALGFLRIGEKQVTGFEVSGRQVALTTRDGVSLAPADFAMKTISARPNRPQEIELEANSLDLQPLARLMEHLPLDESLRKRLAEFNPRGSIFDFRLSWRGELDQPISYSARGRFAGLAMDARGAIPGVENLSGAVVATEKGGSLTLALRDAAVLLPDMLDEARVPLETMSAQFGWSFPNGRFEVRGEVSQFANADAAGSAKVVYRSEPETPGVMELDARIHGGRGVSAVRYLPKHLVGTRTWLATAIQQGKVDEGTFHLKGNLRDWPFIDPKRGSFRVALKLSDTALLYASGWPRIENIRGDLVFERNTVEFHGNASGNIGQAKLGRVDMRIPDLGGRPHLLELQGTADGPTQAFLSFIDQSPVDRMIDGFTETIAATGNGRLTLRIAMPIEEPEKTRLTGQYQFASNDIRIDSDLPPLSRVGGVIAFTESGMTLRGVRGEALGGQFTLAGGNRPDGVIALTAAGNFTVPALRSWLTDPLLSVMNGGAAWRAQINVRKQGGEVVVESGLAGVAIDLPAPLGKAAAETQPLRVVKSAVPGARGEDELGVTLGKVLSARVQRRPEGAEMRFARGTVGIGDAPPALPRAGLALNVAARSFDVDQWRARLLDSRGTTGSATGAPAAATVGAFAPVQASIRAESIDALGRRLTQARLALSQEGNTWNAVVASQEANGTLSFQPGAGNDAGRLTARLKSLTVPATVARQDARDDTPLDRVGQELPAVDIAIDAFEVAEKKLGRLELVANNQGSEWRIQRLNLANPEGTLAATGAWRARRTGEARRKLALDFTLEAQDAGKLLERLGYPATVRAGSGRLEGNVAWEGSPLAIDYPSLSGDVNLRVEKGQFLKAEPGVGKLLGIMSLQALPRRLALDFRDVFSEGFAFDLVSASSHIERGVLSTTDFKMTGVTAAVLMNGEVDLVRETQGLRVVVLPDLSGGMGSVVTALLGNPILGIATYLAQRVLKDPISKAFSFEYVISGTWAEPKVARLQNTQLGQAVEKAATTPPPAPARRDGENPAPVAPAPRSEDEKK